jgi:hypothetical protein
MKALPKEKYRTNTGENREAYPSSQGPGQAPEAFTEAKKDLCSSAEGNASGAASPAICHPERSEGSALGPSQRSFVALRACPERSEGMTDGGQGNRVECRFIEHVVAPTFCELLRRCRPGLGLFFGSGPIPVLRQLDLLIPFSHLL